MKKTIKNYCLNATQSKISELYEIGRRYASVKNEIFYKYGSISGLQYLSYPRQIRDNWVKTKYADKFGLQARYWKMAFDEAFTNIKSNLSNAINKTKTDLYKNQSITKDEKHYAFYLLKATDLLYKAIILEDFDAPDNFQNKDIRRDKVHKYLKNRLRKHIGKKPYQYKHCSFQIDKEMYDVYTDEKKRLWIGIMGLVPRKRIRLQMTSSVKPDGNLRVVLRDKKIEIHNVVDVDIKEMAIRDKIVALDMGFTEVITSSSGKKYGKGFNEILKAESDRLSEKNKNRNKLRALSKNYEEKGDIVKSELIKKNNLGKKKYLKQKEVELNKIKGFINNSLNKFIKEEKPTVIGTEDLVFTNWNKKLTKKVKRYFSSWLKGYLRERIEYKTMLNGVQQVVVNPAYSSQVCHLCGHFGVRKGDKFHCDTHGVLDADHNAALNILNRISDTEITVYTPYCKVKDILQERLRLSNQDSRYSVENLTGQSESERAEYI
jgi:transposase